MPEAKKGRLRWRKKKKSPGMARMFELDSWELTDGATRFASVHEKSGRGFECLGFYWACARNGDHGIDHENTAHSPVENPEQAMTEAKAYVVSCMKKAGTYGR